ncbi:MAG: HAD family hydrolase [Candidatus Hadarchaeota archaeon]
MTYNIMAVFFDLDDTLFDQKKAHRGALRRLKSKYGSLFSDVEFGEMVRAFYKAEKVALQDFRNGKPLEELRLARTADFLDILNVDTSYAGSVNEKFYELYPNVKAPLDGAESLLRDLKDKYQLGIISNGSGRDQGNKLDALGFRKYFETVNFSEEVGSRKPDSKIFLSAMNDLGRDPEECLMVGDSYSADIVGAKLVGMATCWLNESETDSSGEGDEADFEIRKLSEVSNVLNSLSS